MLVSRASATIEKRTPTVEGYIQDFLNFISGHAVWAGPIMFVVSFGESLAFLSLLFPGTALLLAAGALIPSGILPLWPVLLWSIAGATLGDSVSYGIGKRYGWAIERLWPFTQYPDLLPHGLDFFTRHGGKSVFFGRFFGPLRAVIPLAAGLMRMPAGGSGWQTSRRHSCGRPASSFLARSSASRQRPLS